MADADRQHWNQRHAETSSNFEPSAWLRERESLLRPPYPGARALDLACGTGHNSVYLARLGYHVDAWDISDVALDRLREHIGNLPIAPHQVDLDIATIEPDAYDLVLDYNFLDRHLLASMARALSPHGLLLMRALMRKTAGDDRQPAFLLEPVELRRAFANLEELEYLEDAAEGWAAFVGRRME